MEDLNNLLYLYRKSLPDKEKLKIHVANSIWFKEGGAIDVEEDFLQTNANYYDASIYRAPFDEATLKDINLWVKEKTKEMIPEILDDYSEAMQFTRGRVSAEYRKDVCMNLLGEFLRTRLAA